METRMDFSLYLPLVPGFHCVYYALSTVAHTLLFSELLASSSRTVRQAL